MSWTARILLTVMGSAAVACASTSTSFVSSWRAPSAQPLQLSDAKVVAVVMMDDLPARRAAEDKLAQEITARGAQGVAMYSLMPEAGVEHEPEARAALERAGVQGVVVMHPTGTVVPDYVAGDPSYALFWGGYYAYGWGEPWNGQQRLPEDAIVCVDTRIYSLKQNKLVWAGRSQTTSPKSVDGLVVDLASATADQLQRSGLLAKQ